VKSRHVRGGDLAQKEWDSVEPRLEVGVGSLKGGGGVGVEVSG
jgi:hypothetical protein